MLWIAIWISQELKDPIVQTREGISAVNERRATRDGASFSARMSARSSALRVCDRPPARRRGDLLVACARGLVRRTSATHSSTKCFSSRPDWASWRKSSAACRSGLDAGLTCNGGFCSCCRCGCASTRQVRLLVAQLQASDAVRGTLCSFRRRLAHGASVLVNASSTSFSARTAASAGGTDGECSRCRSTARRGDDRRRRARAVDCGGRVAQPPREGGDDRCGAARDLEVTRENAASAEGNHRSCTPRAVANPLPPSGTIAASRRQPLRTPLRSVAALDNSFFMQTDEGRKVAAGAGGGRRDERGRVCRPPRAGRPRRDQSARVARAGQD